MSGKAITAALALAALAAPLGAPLGARPAPRERTAAAAPVDYARIIADPARSAANRALDAGRMPERVLAFAGFRPGMIVADYGAGGGYYSELIAGVVGPGGTVIAMEPVAAWQAALWDPIRARHPNIRAPQADADPMALAPGSVDAIFAHLTWHDLYFVSEQYHHPRLDVPAVLRGWHAALRPGGTVVIIDHVGPPGDPRVVVDKLHRIDPARVRADMAAAGFRFAGASNALRRSDDPHTALVFDPAVRGKTDRFIMKFRKI